MCWVVPVAIATLPIRPLLVRYTIPVTYCRAEIKLRLLTTLQSTADFMALLPIDLGWP